MAHNTAVVKSEVFTSLKITVFISITEACNVKRATSRTMNDTAVPINVCSCFISKLTSALKVMCSRKDFLSEIP